MRKATATMATAMLILGGLTMSAPAFADPPGPGSTQCSPGQNGNPQPGFKPGVCDNHRN
ncbi:hypothetical protein [Microbacterium sp. YJN-G]|uniref:hypothetical protein n=1 Tax=Microbacterium sp. YJN-G TaxID=2763257 RepID=UPI0018777EAD|nr:hypothetical protein [Microbacterium sp. YJN-G]